MAIDGSGVAVEQDAVIVIPDTVADRYSSFEFISWWEQQRVRKATAMVVGAGALGNEVIKGLALMGIGHLLIVDFDTIEIGNLSRCVLFRASDAGLRKAEIAAREVKALNPDVEVEFFCGNINTELGMGIFRRMDVIVGCLDNREARLSVNRFCWQVNKPWVDGGIEALLGYARVFWPHRGACYECTLTERDLQLINQRLSCGLLARENIIRGKVPTTPTIAAIIGGIQTQEALKIVHGMNVEPGVSVLFNGVTNDCYRSKISQRAECMSHVSFDAIIELPEARADTTTPADLLQIARRHLGDTVTLYLGHNLVTALHCPACKQVERLLTPLHHLTESQALCPQCGVSRIPDLLWQFTGGETVATEPLYRLGVPALHILAASAGDRVIGLELTGDAALYPFLASRK